MGGYFATLFVRWREDMWVWVRLLHRAAEFSGVEVITYCCMASHFHILVRVDPAAKDCDDIELVRRFEVLYGSTKAMWCGLDASGLAHALAHDPPEVAERLREKLRARMGNVSEFMRTLRQRFTMWFNRTCDTVGTLWAERFTCVAVEDTPWLVALVAAYIDLNPVRAGLAELPENYCWCGYTEALAGRASLRRALAGCFPRETEESGALASYRLLMLGKGAAAKRDGTGHRVSREDLLAAVEAGGELEAHELLLLKAQFFSRSRAMGTDAWLRSGDGARILSMAGRPVVSRPVDFLKHTDLSVAGGRADLET